MDFEQVGSPGFNRYQLRRYDGVTEHVVGHIETRLNGLGGVDNLRIDSYYVDFDPQGGRLLLWLESVCNTPGCYAPQRWVAAIEGFTSMFEILQTYTPTSGPISFRVPYMPEGFPAADSFSTYHGDLSTVGDWSQAQPLQCAYPAPMPSVGDYLTVPDTLPNPAPGLGRYYVTSVNYQGQTRYGRKTISGVLSGRDPAVLPACVP